MCDTNTSTLEMEKTKMVPAYNEVYLAIAQKNLASMLEYMTKDLRYDLEEAWNLFAESRIAARFGQGEAAIISGRSGVELAWMVLEESQKVVSYIEPSYAYDRSPEYWTGWAIAYYQWLTGLSFTNIEKVIPITHVHELYNPFHEMDVRQFADKMNQMYCELSSETRPKKLDKMVREELDDFSASALAKIDETILNYKKGNTSSAIDLSDFNPKY